MGCSEEKTGQKRARTGADGDEPHAGELGVGHPPPHLVPPVQPAPGAVAVVVRPLQQRHLQPVAAVASIFAHLLRPAEASAV